MRTARGQRQRSGSANAAGSTRDKRDLSMQFMGGGKLG